MADRFSIRDLAKISGFSTATVSLALRGSHEVAPATREKIQALAQEHGYRNHPAVAVLMNQVRAKRRIHDEEIIAFIRSGRDPDEKASGPLELLEGSQKEAYRLGYKVETFWAGFQAARSGQLGRILYSRGIRGVIWGPMPYPHPPIVFPWEHFVPVACTNSTDVLNLPNVCIHHSKGMALVLEELAGRGATRIGVLLNHMEDLRLDLAWINGVDLYHRRGGNAQTPTLVLQHPQDEAAVRHWMDKEQPDAVVMCQSIFQATPYLENLVARASLDVPSADLGRIGGLYQDMRTIGEHAVRSLSMRLTNSILGLPDHPFSLVTQAVFKDGVSLDLLKARCPANAV